MRQTIDFTPTGVFSDSPGGILVQIVEGYEPYVRYRTVYGSQESKVSRPVKIRETAAGRPYFMCHGRRIHLDECMRLCY